MPPKDVVLVGCDHAGLDLKKALAEVLRDDGYEVRDLGTHEAVSTDYPDFAHAVAKRVQAGEGLGLLVCGTGTGMAMAANRHAGVRAAVCGDPFTARMSREHNDANVLCVGARVLGVGLATDIARAFFGAKFEGGRHARRVAKIEPA